jgi:expansin
MTETSLRFCILRRNASGTSQEEIHSLESETMRNSTARTLLGILLVLGLRLSLRAQCPAVPAIHTGEATFYVFADGGGGCMFDPTPDDLMIGAMNATDYDTAAVCGECLSLAGPNGTILIRIVDFCADCAPGNIDLSPSAFARIADTTLGRVPITWQVVACNPTGPIQYHFEPSSSQWWTAVQLRNIRYAVQRLEYRDQAGTYHVIPRTSYNYFVQTPGIGPGPYTFRVTDIYGHVLEDGGVPLVVGGTVSGSGQFPVCEIGTGVDIGRAGAENPGGVELLQNYPNPFNPSTMIRYTIEIPGDVRLSIVDILGREVAVLIAGVQSPGRYGVQWDAARFAAGVYVAVLRIGDRQVRVKMALLR